MNSYSLKTFLDRLYKDFKHKFSSADPVWILHEFKNKRDTEIAALITSCYTFGSVKQINDFVKLLFQRISNKPYEFTINFSKHKDKKYLKGLNYRFIKDSELVDFFDELKRILYKYSSLEDLFFSHYKRNEKIEDAIRFFVSEFTSSSCCFLFPNPDGKSAFKRVNLFLRWMVRKDEIDMGLWDKVHPSQLIIPVDVHIARVSRKLGLIRRRSVDLKFATELTEKLREFDASDPVKYDFALCHASMEGRIFVK